MSVEIVATIICDGCRCEIQGKTQTETSSGQISYGDAVNQMEKRGWVQSLRYGKAKHYCRYCADKPQKAKEP